VASTSLKWPNWVGIIAADLPRQRLFYRDVLRLKELGEGDGWVHFDLGFPNILELIQLSEEKEYGSVRYQVGYAVEDIRSARNELVRRGAVAITEIDGGPDAQGYWCYFEDPEKNVFEISQRLGDAWIP
jgi:predicted enzyme related to lactoylglutathione lyase